MNLSSPRRRVSRGGMLLSLSLAALLVGGASAEDPDSAPKQKKGEWRVSGSLALEARAFPGSPAYPGQLEDVQLSLVAEPEFSWKSNDGRTQWQIAPFARLDAEDSERTHPDLREAYWLYAGDDWDLRAGVARVFWGVTESRHLVDVINQVDGVEDLDEEDRLGQPMVNLGLQRDWGRVDLFVLPGFRERTFAGRDGRLRPPLVVDTDRPIYESGAEEHHVDGAVRYSHFIGDFDIGASWFWGTGREPRFVPSTDGQRFLPAYDLIHQWGVDLQYTREAWLFKLEAMAREGQGRTFGAAVAGFEYTFYGLSQSALDLGVLVEWLWDDRDATAPFSPFDNDLFVGARLAFNDVQDTSLLAGAIVDPDTDATFGLIELERRLNDSFKLELEGRFFADVADDPTLFFVRQDSFLNARFAWFF